MDGEITFDKLPRDLIVYIFSYLRFGDIASFRCVCRAFRAIAPVNDPDRESCGNYPWRLMIEQQRMVIPSWRGHCIPCENVMYHHFVIENEVEIEGPTDSDPYARRIYVRGKTIPYLPRMFFATLTHRWIHCLEIIKCGLRVVPETIRFMKSLRRIVLDDNELTSVPYDAMRDMKDLHYVSVTGNKISDETLQQMCEWLRWDVVIKF